MWLYGLYVHFCRPLEVGPGRRSTHGDSLELVVVRLVGRFETDLRTGYTKTFLYFTNKKTPSNVVIKWSYP